MKLFQHGLQLTLAFFLLMPAWAQQANTSVIKAITKTPAGVLAQPRDVTLHKLQTAFFVPPFKSGGDKDFGGNGPQMRITCQLMISSNRQQILAMVTMSAKESKDNWTMAEGSQVMPVFNCNPGQSIQALGSGTGYTKMDISVTDNNGHADQFFLANGQLAVTAAQNSAWELTNPLPHSSGVELVRVVGDVDGEEAGSRTGVEIFFAPVAIKLLGNAINEIQLNIASTSPTCGINTCGSSASSTVMTFYGFPNTCEQMKAKLDASPNLINTIRSVSGYNIGIDPNSMRDRMNEINNRFTAVEARPNQMLTHVVQALNNRKPVIILTGWGSRTIRNIYANSSDPVSLNPNSVLHYLVIDGFNRQTNVYSVIDNGRRIYLKGDYIKQIVYWRPENAIVEGALYSNQVKPGMIIY